VNRCFYSMKSTGKTGRRSLGTGSHEFSTDKGINQMLDHSLSFIIKLHIVIIIKIISCFNMPILLEKDASTFQIGVLLGCWALNFFDSLAGLFISLYMVISHDDLEQDCVEPVELSNNLN